MTWLAIEHERRAFQDDPHDTAGEAKYMSRDVLIKARFGAWGDMHNVVWFWIPIGNCAACRFFTPAGQPDGPGCRNPNAAIRKRFLDYVNANTCPGFVAGENRESGDMADVMRAVGLTEGEPSQPVEILQRVPWSRWASHQARSQQAHFLATARAHDAGSPDRSHGHDLGPIDA